MDQMNSLAMSMFQTAANTTELPKTGGKGDGAASDFQKLMEKTQSSQTDSQIERRPKAKTETGTTAEKSEAPAQKQEDPLERAKKLAEQGAWFTQPGVGYVDVDLMTGEIRGTYEPGEYILAHMDGRTELIPVTGLDPAQTQELKGLLGGMNQVIDVSDPEADAILEATDPNADHSPAAMLEKLADENFGQAAPQTAESVRPRQEEENDGIQAEVTDAEQAPQRVFRDVENVPVKVGEAESAEPANEADVIRQVENQIGQVMQSGESTVTVRLNPESLGEVTVQVSMKPDGVLSVAISARSDDTRALLERHTAQLQELVSSRTQQSVEVNVQRQQESQQNQQHGYDGHNGHAQDGQQERRQRRGHTSSQDFMQQLRLGLIPADGES